jgi:hypothetical protein
MQMSSEKTLIRCRDKLIENKLFEYEKGTKSKPNKYKISTVNFTANNKSTVNNTVDTTVNMTVDVGVDVSNINRLDKDIYINLLNKYKKRMEKAKYFSDKIHIQNELKKDKEYLNLTEEEKNNMFKEIM